jgi:oligoribonuclease NrnB/cAMP/cGMP phosphodiesterase (DHH superfamily)
MNPDFKNNIDTIVFHYPCQDGLSSAWVAYYYYKINFPSKTLRLFPAQHGKELIYDMVGENILFMDFCPSLEVIDLLRSKRNEIYILDHHITAKDSLTDCPFANFNMDKAGVGLTWEYFFPESDKPIPRFLAMIQERDLWKFRIEQTQEFSNGLFFESECLATFEQKFALFEELYTNPEKLDQVIQLGTILNNHKQMKITSIVKKTIEKKYYCTDKLGNSISIICYNCSADIASDLGNALSSEHCDMAILWTYDHLAEIYHYSLRSTNKVDCARLAKKYLEGGGHPNAAGGKHILHPTEFIKNVLFTPLKI